MIHHPYYPLIYNITKKKMRTLYLVEKYPHFLSFIEHTEQLIPRLQRIKERKHYSDKKKKINLGPSQKEDNTTNTI